MLVSLISISQDRSNQLLEIIQVSNLAMVFKAYKLCRANIIIRNYFGSRLMIFAESGIWLSSVTVEIRLVNSSSKSNPIFHLGQSPLMFILVAFSPCSRFIDGVAVVLLSCKYICFVDSHYELNVCFAQRVESDKYIKEMHSSKLTFYTQIWTELTIFSN